MIANDITLHKRPNDTEINNYRSYLTMSIREEGFKWVAANIFAFIFTKRQFD